MKLETYTEIEKIVLKGMKDDYFLFELSSAFLGALLVIAMWTFIANTSIVVMIATGIIVFVIWYQQADRDMQDKIAKRKALMDEVKKDMK